MEKLFDDISRIVASPMPRRRALKLIAGALAGGTLATVWPGRALADECAGKPDGTPCTDDGNQCTDDICQGGICTHPNKPNGTGCDDGNICTDPDYCHSGYCIPGPHANEGGSCNDGFNCTTDDICIRGGCTGTPKDCSHLDDIPNCIIGKCVEPSAVCAIWYYCDPVTQYCDNGDCKNKMLCGIQYCDPGQVCCSGTCTQLGTNDNCRDCGDECTGGKVCICVSPCECKCPEGKTECDGLCVTPCTSDSCGEGNTCEDGCCVPAITLLSFTAKVDDSNVILAWETATEIDNAGFNVWRSEAGKEQYVKLNNRLIPGQGYTYKDTSYSFTDTTVTAGVTYDYKLEDVDIHGVSTLHGPVSVSVGLEKPQVTLRLDAGVNLISVPLKPGKPWTLRNLADFIGEENLNMIIYLQNGRFLVYDPDWADSRSASVPIAGDDAYIVVMKSPTSVTFTGDAWAGKVSLSKGFNLMAVPVNPGETTLRDIARKLGSNLSSLFWYNPVAGRFVEYQPSAAAHRQIRAGEGYIVSMTAPSDLTFEGEAWTTEPATLAATPALMAANRTATPLLMVEGTVLQRDTGQPLDGVKVTVRNLNTGSVTTTDASSEAERGQYRVLLADLKGNRAAQVGDVLEITAQAATSSLKAEPMKRLVTKKDVQAGKISLGTISLSQIPKKSVLLANYPNPFNPETWIPYKLAEAADVTIRIYNTNGQLVRNLILGNKAAGTYINREKAAYWDGKNDYGERVASGVYFYSIKAGKFSATRRMVLIK